MKRNLMGILALVIVFFGLFSYYMQGLPIVVFFTLIFMKIILLGVRTPLEKVLERPPSNIFSTPIRVVLKADLVIKISWLKGFVNIFKIKKDGI